VPPQLVAIIFNHDPTSSGTSALNIRRNFARAVSVPEWQAGVSVNPADSVAAYAIKETAGGPVTIQAKIRYAGPGAPPAKVEVRAVHPTLPFNWQLLPYYDYYTLWQVMLQTQVNVLGEVAAREVPLHPNGESDFETFTLQNMRLAERGVGVHSVVWHWQYRETPAGPWTDFAVTRHRVYTVLQTPTLPWVQLPFDANNTQLPWTDVLDFACRWAAQAYTLDQAATLITRGVYSLGNGLLEYGCPIGTVTTYAFPFFNCTAFIDRLRGGIGMGRYVNCSDCASMVTTFANVLGCDLWQGQMLTFGIPFPVNPIRAIGSLAWETPCASLLGSGLSFTYHEVAWKGNCTALDEVFDACLEVDSSLPPFPPFTPLLAANLRFGFPGEGQYRDLLSPPWGRHLCEPQPLTKQRRMVI
jgi:hypothetical protein